jgi:hypothetical protein
MTEFFMLRSSEESLKAGGGSGGKGGHMLRVSTANPSLTMNKAESILC